MDPDVVLTAAQDAGADHADLRIERLEEQRIEVQDDELRGLTSHAGEGFAIRVLVDGVWGFAAADGTQRAVWKRAVERAVRLARSGSGQVALADAPVQQAEEIWRPRKDPRDVDVDEKRALLRAMDEAVRKRPEVRHVTTRYTEETLRKEYADTDGTRIRWGLTRTVAHVQFTAKRDGRLAGRSTRVGGTKGYEVFDDEDPVAKAEAAAAAVVHALDAKVAKGGRTTVVVDPELAGVFAHEAVGHAAEADLIAAGESCFQGRMGERLGIEGLHIHDDCTMRGAFGAYPFDDDGVPGGDRPILRDGVLVGVLADREHAARLGVPPNGAARAQDHMHRPLVRMGTTLIEPGDHSEEEVFEGIKDGIYCVGSRGGQVDTARGTFLFHAQDAWRIQDGRVTTPLRDVSLTGDILETLHRIDALGDQRRLGDPGYCGKGQWVPVCDGVHSFGSRTASWGVERDRLRDP